MALRRRDFLAAAAAVSAGALGGKPASAADEPKTLVVPKGKAALKLSSQEGLIPGNSLKEKLDTMEKWGFAGLEVGGGGLPGRVKEIKEALKDRPIKMSAICAGFKGWLIADDPEIRKQAMFTMKEILSAAGELGSTGLIIVPAFNGQKSLPHKEARQLLTGFDRWDHRKEHTPKPLLLELGEHAAKAGTRILLEPLNRDECYFLRTLADGASICKDVNHPGIAMMGDFWHMTWEETSDLGAFVTAGDYLHHVHMASRRSRRVPGEDGDADNYVQGFKGLKAIGYQDYVSFECGCSGDRNVMVPNAVKLLREQWEEA
jgi:sugar phosphate isomerase/epimerase